LSIGPLQVAEETLLGDPTLKDLNRLLETIAVTDAFDAITTDRFYQKARTFHEALARYA